MAHVLLEHTKAKIAHLRVPNLSQTEFNRLHEEQDGFCSNLVWTIKDFCNKFHQDREYNSYTYGIRARVCEKNGELATRKNVCRCEGGEFFVGSYKVYIDFDAWNRIVEIIWHGKTDYYSTIPSTTALGYARIGAFVQVNKGLVKRMKKLIMIGSEGVDIANKVRSEKTILDSKLQIVK